MASETRVAPPLLETARLILRMPDESEAAEVIRYFSENRERLRPVDPHRPDYFYDEAFWRRQLRQNVEDCREDRALRLFLFRPEEPARVIGNVGLSNFVRGVGQYCTVGYSIGGEFEGRGYMAEALRSAIDYAFNALGFHRIEANYMPHNTRSAVLLRRLGFAVEGYSRDYLHINGRWEDHIRSALLSPA